MMTRAMSLLLAVCAITASATTVNAEDLWHRVKLDWHRVNCWPEPFVHADRAAARAPFEAMAAKGWQLQNTLSHHHFDRETQQLTSAGELKIRSILTNSPTTRRSVYVLRGDKQEVTSIRVDTVQQALSRIVTEGPLPEVVRTDIAPRGWPAGDIDAINRNYQASTPSPRLPASESGETDQ